MIVLCQNRSFISLQNFVSVLVATIVLVGCAQSPTTTTSKDTVELDNLIGACWPDSDRSPSAEKSCRSLFLKTNPNSNAAGVDSMAYSMAENPNVRPDLMSVEAASDDKAPLKMTESMKQFRRDFMPFIANSNYREAMIRMFESQMRMRSEVLSRQIAEKGTGQYDAVIVGAGVHGIIALHEFLAKNPKAKVLMIDEGDTAGATFRYGKEIFNINSSNRASGPQSTPLPGLGNINELPGLPIQVSDLTAVKYPSANDLGSALVSALYAASRQHKNVDILFNTKVTKSYASGVAQFGEALDVLLKDRRTGIQVTSQKTIIASGLGTPKAPVQVLESLENSSVLKTSEGNIPRVLNFEDFIRLMGQFDNPMAMLKDLNIAVAGTGDSANVLIEFFMGYASKDAYGISNAQSGKPQKIYWLGQDITECNDFINQTRSRYAQIGTGFRSSSDKVEALIEPRESKLAEIEVNKSDLTLKLDSREGKIKNIDLVILATGFSPNIRSILSKPDGSSQFYANDDDYMKKEMEIITGPTSVSKGRSVKIGRRIKGRNLYLVGTAAGKLPADNELVGIIQNSVSIFNNAPRVISTVRKIGAVQPMATQTTKQKPAEPDDQGRKFLITDIDSTRMVPGQTMTLIKSIFRDALALQAFDGKQDVTIQFNLIDSDIKVDVSGKSPSANSLMHILASSREFFSTLKRLLEFEKGKYLKISFSVNANGQAEMNSVQVTLQNGSSKAINKSYARISNSQIKLRRTNTNAFGIPYAQKSFIFNKSLTKLESLNFKPIEKANGKTDYYAIESDTPRTYFWDGKSFVKSAFKRVRTFSNGDDRYKDIFNSPKGVGLLEYEEKNYTEPGESIGDLIFKGKRYPLPKAINGNVLDISSYSESESEIILIDVEQLNGAEKTFLMEGLSDPNPIALPGGRSRDYRIFDRGIVFSAKGSDIEFYDESGNSLKQVSLKYRIGEEISISNGQMLVALNKDRFDERKIPICALVKFDTGEVEYVFAPVSGRDAYPYLAGDKVYILQNQSIENSEIIVYDINKKSYEAIRVKNAKEDDGSFDTDEIQDVVLLNDGSLVVSDNFGTFQLKLE